MNNKNTSKGKGRYVILLPAMVIIFFYFIPWHGGINGFEWIRFLGNYSFISDFSREFMKIRILFLLILLPLVTAVMEIIGVISSNEKIIQLIKIFSALSIIGLIIWFSLFVKSFESIGIGFIGEIAGLFILAIMAWQSTKKDKPSQVVMRKETKFCTACGGKISSDDKFCPNCGKEVSEFGG